MPSGFAVSTMRFVISMSAEEGVGYVPFLTLGPLRLIYRIPPAIPLEPKTLAEHLRARRAQRGLTQRQAAIEIGVVKDAYARWELGMSAPRNRRLLASVIAFLGYDPKISESAFGEWLVERRKSLGLTPSEMAERLDMSVVTLRTWERGVRPSGRRTREMEARIVELAGLLNSTKSK